MLRAISSRSTPCIAKKTFEAAAEAQAHLIVQLKDNQPTLCRKAEAVCNDTKPLSCVQTVDSKKRNRHETRTVAVLNARPAVAGTEWQPHVAAIIAIERNVLTFRRATGLWNASREIALYLSNPLSVPARPPMPFADIGLSKTNSTTPETSPSAKTPRASAATRASPVCGRSADDEADTRVVVIWGRGHIGVGIVDGHRSGGDTVADRVAGP
jgi:hypothetical protein